MKQFILIAAASLLLGAMATENAHAQNGLLGRIFGSRPIVQRNYAPAYSQNYTPVYQRSYSYARNPARTATPVTGYGSNLHRNYMIRRAQKQAAITGIPPRNTGNIYWAR